MWSETGSYLKKRYFGGCFYSILVKFLLSLGWFSGVAVFARLAKIYSTSSITVVSLIEDQSWVMGIRRQRHRF